MAAILGALDSAPDGQRETGGKPVKENDMQAWHHQEQFNEQEYRHYEHKYTDHRNVGDWENGFHAQHGPSGNAADSSGPQAPAVPF
jgi:hypothetical protein